MLKHIFKLENRIMLNAVSPVPEILVISEGVNDYADLAAAVDENVEVITYDPDTDNLTDLLADIGEASDGSIDVISFATHDDGSGGIQLTAEETVTAESLNTDAEQQAFFNGLADLMTENGRIDFLACSVADSVETSVESFVGKGINVAISNDITGNSGDWMLESDGIDLTGANGYFDANALEAFTGSMNTTTTSVTTGKTTVTYVDADSEASAIVIDLSLDPNASRDITFHNGAGSDERVHISST
ncbi:MAG: DUF4347 domain-containing protein, partial [Deltaproteobacteria bacterium]|nr:DUF4347 domain-containing protein [Deltaproteobacteria bacterium]